MRAVSPRERRLLALAGLLAVLALVRLALIGPLVDGFANRRAARAALLMRYAHDAGSVAAIPRLRRRAERQEAAARLYVSMAASADGARGVLRDRLRRAVEGAGGELRAGGDAAAPPGWIGARGEARMTPAQLYATLALLENTPPAVVVDALSVTAPDLPDPLAPASNPSSPPSGALTVRIRLAVPFRLAPAR